MVDIRVLAYKSHVLNTVHPRSTPQHPIYPILCINKSNTKALGFNECALDRRTDGWTKWTSGRTDGPHPIKMRKEENEVYSGWLPFSP